MTKIENLFFQKSSNFDETWKEASLSGKKMFGIFFKILFLVPRSEKYGFLNF